MEKSHKLISVETQEETLLTGAHFPVGKQSGYGGLVIAADTVSTILCATQGLWWMTALYAAYAVSAVIGYVHWKRNGRYMPASENI